MTLGRERLLLPAGQPLDARIAAVAEAQHGAIAVRQLAVCGLSPSAARDRVASGRLRRLHRGVYAPGHRRLPRLGGVAAAVLACGPRAVASHRTAGMVHDLRPDNRLVIDVAVHASGGRRLDHIVVHSARRLRPHDVCVVDAIPVTSVARTLLDCASVVGRRAAEKMVLAAERTGVFDMAALRDLLRHVPGHPGGAVLRAALEAAARTTGDTASVTEDVLLSAFRLRGLPEPECNAPIQLDTGAFVFADFLWREARLVVEADPLSHDNRASYRSDRRRDRALDRLGFETMRFSDLDLSDPNACAAEVQQRHDFRLSSRRKS